MKRINHMLQAPSLVRTRSLRGVHRCVPGRIEYLG